MPGIKTWIGLSGIGLLLTVTGCNHAPGAATPDPLAASEYPRVAALDSFKGHLVYDTPVVSRPDDRPMSVSVPVRLTRSKEAQAQYRFIFFDQHGRPLEADPSWQFTFLPAKAQAFLEGSALEMKAMDWRLEVRPSHVAGSQKR